MMKIAAAQTPISRDPQENVETIVTQVKAAAAEGVELVQFAEGALGYALKDEETDWDGVAAGLDCVRAVAREAKVWVVFGSTHRVAERRPHNSLYAVSSDGEIAARYDKRMCSHNEITNIYSPGFEPVVFEANGFRFGLALCIEANFPELFVEYEQLGVDCVLFSAYSGDAMFGVMAQGHAAANNLWLCVSTPARNGSLPAGVIGPDGHWMEQLQQQSAPGLAIATLDRGDPRFHIPLNKARPWRRAARAGAIYRDGVIYVDPGPPGEKAKCNRS